jgi:uncharacterized protein (DUF433 family)
LPRIAAGVVEWQQQLSARLLAMSSVAYAHLEINDQGVPVLLGTTTKVVEIALDHLAHHWDADEIRRQHPHLSLGQIHSALAYYFDHQDEFDFQIRDQLDAVDRLRQSSGPSPVIAKARRLGRAYV